MSDRSLVSITACCCCALAPLTAAMAAPDGACGTHVTDHDHAILSLLQDAGVYDDVAAPIGLTYVPLTFHVVTQDDGSGGISDSRLCQAVDDANAGFLGAGIQFYVVEPINFIASDAFYFDIDSDAEVDALRMVNPVANTINIYFTNNLADDDGGLCGKSSFTSSPVQGIVMANVCTGLSSNPSTFPHEIGHYFNLFHTHETFFGVECVDGSNCAVAGDLVCDTAADPSLTGLVSPSCGYTGSATDSCNGDLYAPDPTNYMSFSLKECRDFFSGGQRNRSLGTLITLRPELVNPSIPAGSDCNGNGITDFCEVDCNDNGIPDECDIADGTSEDCNTNGVPDECDLDDGTSQDCNTNGYPDECDIADGTSEDCNTNGVPDECDLADGTSEDCNTNGYPDECDIADGTSEDCNTNGVPDECDLADGTSEDCNDNGVPDECDIANGTSEDCNLNGIPDECDTAPEYDPAIAAAQDDCGNAEYVGPGFLYLDDTFGATTDGPIFCGPFYGVYDVWYKYRPAWTGIAFASTFGPGTNPLIAIHSDCPATSENVLGCDRAHFGVTFYVERAETYWIRVAGAMFTQGPFKLNLIGPKALLNLDDTNLNGIPDECECPTDVNGDGVVDLADFIAVSAAVGGPCDGCPEDVDGSGAVDEVDQQLVLIDQGFMCPFTAAAAATGGDPDKRGAAALD